MSAIVLLRPRPAGRIFLVIAWLPELGQDIGPAQPLGAGVSAYFLSRQAQQKFSAGLPGRVVSAYPGDCQERKSSE